MELSMEFPRFICKKYAEQIQRCRARKNDTFIKLNSFFSSNKYSSKHRNVADSSYRNANATHVLLKQKHFKYMEFSNIPRKRMSHSSPLAFIANGMFGMFGDFELYESNYVHLTISGCMKKNSMFCLICISISFQHDLLIPLETPIIFFPTVSDSLFTLAFVRNMRPASFRQLDERE